MLFCSLDTADVLVNLHCLGGGHPLFLDGLVEGECLCGVTSGLCCDTGLQEVGCCKSVIGGLGSFLIPGNGL